MTSKITIEVDFDNNNTPIIQIVSRQSDDIRDKLIKSFLEKLGSQSSWCTIRATWTHQDGSQQWIITPISNDELQTQSRLMAAIDNLGNPFKLNDEYVCLELNDENNNFIGLNIFHNGEVVHTWAKPK